MNAPAYLDWRTCSCGEEYHRSEWGCDCDEEPARPVRPMTAEELAESEAAIEAFAAELAAREAS
jgi:hypothetical protein